MTKDQEEALRAFTIERAALEAKDPDLMMESTGRHMELCDLILFLKGGGELDTYPIDPLPGRDERGFEFCEQENLAIIPPTDLEAHINTL